MTRARRVHDAVGTSRVLTARVQLVNTDGTAVIEWSHGANGANAERVPATVVTNLALQTNDDVLATIAEDGLAYVLGVISRANSPVNANTVSTRDGVRAERVEDAAGERLEVRDAQGRMVFEHQSETGRRVVYAEGDLAFSAPRGSIEFAARDSVRVRSEGTVELTAKQRLEVGAPKLDARIREATVASESVDLTAKLITTTAERARHAVGVLETTAVRILERAKNVYRDAEELSQTRAGRMKFVVRETLSAISRRTVLKSEKDTRVDGEKIYLG